MKPTIAIIGGNGFIGKNLTLYFSSRGYMVKVIGRHLSSVYSISENVVYIKADIRDTNQIIEGVADAEFIIWLAHTSVPSINDVSSIDEFQTNIAPIIQFLEGIKKSDTILKKFIYMSSGGTVYGNINTQNPIQETEATEPISNYGLSKSIAEKYIKFLTRFSPFSSIILRPSNVYGKFQNLIKPQGIVGYAFKAIHCNYPLDVYDDGRVVRDFIYVDDVASAIERFVESESVAGQTSIFNIGSNKGITIKELLQKIETIAGKNLTLNHKSSRSFDCEYNVLDSSQLIKEIDWSPQVDLDEGLEKVWDWIRNE